MYIETNEDLASSLNANGELVLFGTDLATAIASITEPYLDLVLAEKSLVEGQYVIQGQTETGEIYSTVIEDVEKITLTSDEVEYIGEGSLNGSDDSYQLLIGGQGDLGDMLYVTTGESLLSTTGVSGYNVDANFITGEIYYSGHHSDFDRSVNPSNWATSVAGAYLTAQGSEGAEVWNEETAEFFVWYDANTSDQVEGFEIAVKFQNGLVNQWGIDNRHFDTFQTVTLNDTLVNDIKLQFGDNLSIETGDYRVLYEAAFSDIETIIGSNDNVNNWNFDFEADSSRSTFYIQVGGNATGENGNADTTESNLINIKVERQDDGEGFYWKINPQAEILVNMPTVVGASPDADIMISGDTAETIEAGKGSDVMMGRGGSDNYKINEGDTLQVDDNGDTVVGDYGVAGDVINEIGGSSDDKSDAITLSNASSIEQLTFIRTEIKNEEWSNSLQIDVDYNNDNVVDDTIFVFDHYNQNLGFRSVEKLYLDDGWDSDEIWNLVVGDKDANTGELYQGSSGQDILIAGLIDGTTLDGGAGKDIMIGDDYGMDTTFVLGDVSSPLDDGSNYIHDMIQGFGKEDTLDLSKLGIADSTLLKVDGNNLTFDYIGQVDDTADDKTIVLAEFSNFQDGITLEDLILQDSTNIAYGA